MNSTFQESQIVELKKIWKDEYLKTICAFANTDGGTLYIGIDDSRNATGLDDITKLIDTLPNKINNRLGLLVDLSLEMDLDNDYLKVIVSKTFAPVSCAGKFYKRSGSNTIELNGSNLTNFLLKKYGKTWDDIT